MKLTRPTLREATAGLRALKVILHTDIDIEHLTPITPQELAGEITRPEVRELLAGAMVIHSFASGEAGAEHLAHVEAYVSAMGVALAEVNNLRQHTQRNMAMRRFDIIRQMYIGEGMRNLGEDEGFKGVRTDPEMAARHHALADRPEGTLGRAFFHHCRDNSFPFPGEQYVAPVTEPLIGNLDPERLLAALERGSQMTVDLFDGWDPWPVIDQPLSVLRQRYGIHPAR